MKTKGVTENICNQIHIVSHSELVAFTGTLFLPFFINLQCCRQCEQYRRQGLQWYTKHLCLSQSSPSLVQWDVHMNTSTHLSS